MRHRRLALIAGSLLLLTTLAVRQPSADVRVMLHDAGDTAPHRFQAAVDLGLMAVSVLVTWTGKHWIATR